MEPRKIVEIKGSKTFILYTILIILAIILALMVCFCPGLVLCIFSAIFTKMIKFTTTIATLFCKCMQFIYGAIVDAYLARKNEDVPDDTIQVAATTASPVVSEPLLVRFVLRDRLK